MTETTPQRLPVPGVGPALGVDVLLADGTIGTIVPGPDERPLALELHYDGEAVAWADAERIEPATAEVSIRVAGHMLGRGLATLLLEHLAARARRDGVRRFVARVPAGDEDALRVLKTAGFDVEEATDEEDVHRLALSTEATERAIEAADARECAAERRSLRGLMEPEVVAVIGVSRSGRGVGRAVVDAILEGGFPGKVVVIHPDLAPIDGVEIHPTLAAVPEPIDLLVISVPVSGVADVVEEAGQAGVPVAVVITSGFAEAGRDGRDAQAAMVRSARRHGLRLIGPNCFGVGSYRPDVMLDATFARQRPQPGGLAVASQSGGVGIALVDAAVTAGLGLASFVSLGNKADVSSNDLLGAWIDDDRVTAAALYLESFGNPRKFARLARRFSERKPLIAVVGGRSAGGSRAGASHTAAAASPTVAVEAVFAQAGVIPVNSLDELVDVAQLLTRAPLPSGRRLGIIGNAGGLGVLAADSASGDGVDVPMLSEVAQDLLRKAIGDVPGMTNPIDLGAAASPQVFEDAVRALLDSGELDGLLVIFAATRVGDTAGVMSGIRRAALGARIPVLLVAHGDEFPAAGAPEEEADPPMFRTVRAATRAFAHASKYAVWRSTPRGTARPAVPEAATAARSWAHALLVSDDHGGWLDPREIQELVGHHGIKAPTGEVARGVADVIDAARRIGYPVAAKVADPKVLHKSDRGLVAVGLASDADVAAAVTRFGAELGDAEVPVLVQQMVTGGVEVAIGVVRDASFGPLVMVAAGGVATEVWKDRVFLVPPVTDLDAARAVRSLRIAPLLEGYRGAPAGDVEALQELLVAVSRLAEDVPELAEMDLNPVVVLPDGVACVDARIRLAEAPLTGALLPGAPPQLRMP